jgi:hypothetical protein
MADVCGLISGRDLSLGKTGKISREGAKKKRNEHIASGYDIIIFNQDK